MDRLFLEIMREASFGNVVIDGDSFAIAFNSVIFEHEGVETFSNFQDNNFPTLIIKDKKLFLSKLSEYMSLALHKVKNIPTFVNDPNRNRLKILMAFLFSNATTEDFSDPIKLIERHISFLTDSTFAHLNTSVILPLDGSFDNSSIEIMNVDQSVLMETPKKMSIALVKETDKELLRYALPSISYGIIENSEQERECYIYSILHSKEKSGSSEKQQEYSKYISRALYKLNSGIREIESEEYMKYLSDVNSYYPENILDVPVSSVLALTIFIGLLEKENVKKIKAVPYIPVRFLARELTAQKQTNDSEREKFENRNDRLQENITDTFIRLFNRVKFHLNGIEITSFPYDTSEFLEISINNANHDFNNSILRDSYNSIIHGLSDKSAKK